MKILHGKYGVEEVRCCGMDKANSLGISKSLNISQEQERKHMISSLFIPLRQQGHLQRRGACSCPEPQPGA